MSRRKLAAGALLTMREAAVLYAQRVDADSSGKWMRRYLQRRAPAAIVRLGEGKFAPWYTSEHMLRRYCPEFFSHKDSAVKLVNEGVSEVRGMIHELSARLNALAARVRKLEAAGPRT